MGKVLGLDLGTRTLGIAISDASGWYAYGLENFRFEEGNYQKAAHHAVEIAQKEQVNVICLGLPLNMNGTMSPRAESALRFKEELLALLPTLTIEMIDERWTTKIAANRLLEANLSRNKRKKVIDQQAAVVILETYLAQKGKE